MLRSLVLDARRPLLAATLWGSIALYGPVGFVGLSIFPLHLLISFLYTLALFPFGVGDWFDFASPAANLLARTAPFA
ncbi:MAG: hypothetical protein AVDCRST_MAG39-570 [uncultured Sphingomonadaceae bacterium]|uniref:Uncharacterized protein n=1 Tax=uncultured Sphingomonadaceae bacterium TaxID=169976 RepID=A0A6J4S3L5_9SPHN|nr:MAG: hypothetical protein AVDCRST_MAG39-570 [uncultured Sphingomonadaceae bacterium]